MKWKMRCKCAHRFTEPAGKLNFETKDAENDDFQLDVFG